MSVVLQCLVLAKCVQFFLIKRPACRDVDKHLVVVFLVSAAFFASLTVANVLYFNRITDQDLQVLLALWSGFVIFNMVIQLSLVTLVTKRVTTRHFNRGESRGMG